MRLPPELACPGHRLPLEKGGAPRGQDTEALVCPRECAFPVRGGIPRFVTSSGYAAAFGLQWNTYRRTQLDSYTGTTISHDRLVRCLGGSLEVVRGKSVLEVGCGAGRFTEVLLDAGARVFACDLSDAVEANRDNCGRAQDYFVCQADVLALPAARGAFDVVLALGMVQHTPSPEATLAALAEMLKPGGLLALDHYRPSRSRVLRVLGHVAPRSLLRHLLLRLPRERALRATTALTRALLPLHRALWTRGPVVDRLRAVWRRVSPVFDYFDRYPELGAHLEEWAYLDTHDGLTDRHKHLRTAEQIRGCLESLGLDDLDSVYAGNGVEARARRPAAVS